jgi:amino acid transporter
MADAAIAQPVGQPKLATGALGLGAQLFQSITHMAPVAGIVFSVQYMATQGGASLTLAYVLATIACTLTALCLKELVRKVRSAGGYFVIHSVALGHFAGFTTSWFYFMYDPLIPGAAASLLWGIVTHDFLAEFVGIEIPWFLFAVVMALILTYVSYVGVRQSARITMVLGTIETVVFGILGIILILGAGGNQPTVSFSFASSHNGFGGVMFALIFAILSYIGFEAGVPLAEESRNARRNLTIGIMVSTVGIGIFYCFMAYATVAGWGNYGDPAKFADEFGNAKEPFFAMAGHAFGRIGPLIMFLLITNSLYAVGVAGTNAVTRVYYSLGRSGVFPKALAYVNPKTQTPANAIFLQGAINIILAAVFGFAFGVEPIVAYGLVGLLMTIGAVVLYMMTNVSCFVLYWGRYRSEFNAFNHLVIPILATVVFVPPLVASLYPDALTIFGIPSFTLTYPVSLALPITVIWALIGLAIYFFLRTTRPHTLETMANEMARVELVGEVEDPTGRAVRPGAVTPR